MMPSQRAVATKTPAEAVSFSGQERRVHRIERRSLIDSKFLGHGKCIDQRKSTRRNKDQFDPVAWDKLCADRLGPGWL